MNPYPEYNGNNTPMHYKLTMFGRIVFLILVILIVAAIYFAVDYFVLKPPSDDNNPQIENNNPQIENNNPQISAQEDDDSDVLQKSGSDNDVFPEDSSPSVTSHAITERLNDSGILSDIPAVKTSVYFGPESSALTDDAKKVLNRFIEENSGLEHYLIVLEGNCATTLAEPIDEEAKNAHLQLSLRRANAVKDYLTTNLLDEIEVVNLGSDNPNNDNSTFTKRIANRRVDIYLYKEKVT